MKNDFKPFVGHRFNLRADWALSTAGSWQSTAQNVVLHVGGLWSRDCRHLDARPNERGDPLRIE